MLDPEERAQLDDLCDLYGVPGATPEERYGRLALLLSERPARKRGRPKDWTDVHLLLFLDLVERQMALNGFRLMVTRDGVETMHLANPDNRKVKVAVAQLKERFPGVLGKYTDGNLIKKVSAARRLRDG